MPLNWLMKKANILLLNIKLHKNKADVLKNSCKATGLKIPCGKITGNLNVRNLLSFYIRSLTPWQDHGEYARYPFYYDSHDYKLMVSAFLKEGWLATLEGFEVSLAGLFQHICLSFKKVLSTLLTIKYVAGIKDFDFV
jgi:hypothetical protein